MKGISFHICYVIVECILREHLEYIVVLKDSNLVHVQQVVYAQRKYINQCDHCMDYHSNSVKETIGLICMALRFISA